MKLLLPDWPAPPGVHAACTRRHGGVSAAPYDTLNLGDHVGDSEANVAANRERFVAALGVRPVFLKQVHGARCVDLTQGTRDGIEADACVADEPGLACTIMVADCLPVLLADVQGRAVAAAHAGWRGLVSGVVDAAVRAMPKGELIAWLGPCIGPDAFEVGPEVKAAYVERDTETAQFFKPHTAPGKFLADLPGLARHRLRALGVLPVYGNDGSDAWCTVSNRSEFFSHRRDRVSGRFAAAIWLG